MNLRRCVDNPPAHRALLRVAAWLVPAARRTDWLAEWRAELWHIHHERQLFAGPADPPAEDALAFCLGAFPDALWLRRNSLPQPSPTADTSARRCWLTLAACAASVMVLAVALPGPRAAMRQAAYLNASSIVNIVPEGVFNNSRPTMPLADYLAWNSRAQHLFTRFAFFAPTTGTLQYDGITTAPRPIGIASVNFFDLLQVPLLFSNFSYARIDGKPAALISEASWRRDFAAYPAIVGQPIRIAGHDAIIAGVIAENAWAFPGRSAAAWLLQSPDSLATLPSNTSGFLFAAVNPRAVAANPAIGSIRWHMDVPVRPGTQPRPAVCAEDASRNSACRIGDSDGFDCIALAATIERPSSVFLFMLVLALLALPATIPLTFSDEPVVTESLFAGTRWRRWGFLLAKFAVIVPLVYFGALDLAYIHAFSPATSEYLQLASSFAGCLVLFRWALYDQRSRCPVCLRQLTNPVRVGEPSRNFLAWSGTEMICSRGHGLLHTPAIPTSWIGARRWLHLDPSWQPLFSDA